MKYYFWSDNCTRRNCREGRDAVPVSNVLLLLLQTKPKDNDNFLMDILVLCEVVRTLLRYTQCHLAAIYLVSLSGELLIGYM